MDMIDFHLGMVFICNILYMITLLQYPIFILFAWIFVFLEVIWLDIRHGLLNRVSVTGR